MLIIVDKCSRIFEENKKSFSKTLKYLAAHTDNCKVIVISRSPDDIKPSPKCQFQISELDKMQAAKLLLMTAGTGIQPIYHKNPKSLAEHPIFKCIGYNPQQILHLAPLLQH